MRAVVVLAAPPGAEQGEDAAPGEFVFGLARMLDGIGALVNARG